MSNTNDILEKVRFFFTKTRWKSILTFSFFVVLATIFWAMQIYRQKFEETITIPIRYVDVPENIIFDTELPTEIKVRVKDDGANLVRYSISKKNDSLEININQKLNINRFSNQTIQGQTLEELIRTKLFAQTELLSFSPSDIEYNYQVLHEKKVPVYYKGYIDLAPGAILNGEISMTPEYVTAYGSKQAIDTLQMLFTLNDTIHDISEAKTLQVPIQPMAAMKLRPSYVNLHLPVDNFFTKEVEVPVECINLPPNLSIKFFPSSIKIPFDIGKGRSDKVNASDFQVIVDYQCINSVNDPMASTPVNIIKYPDYIKLKMPIPSEVEFILEVN